MGTGPGGSYLYALLKQEKPEVQTALFNISSDNPCGIRGCAWGLNYSLFTGLCRDVGLIPEKYVLRYCDHIFIERVKIDASMATIDKPLLLRDLLRGAMPQPPSQARWEDYDRIIDASGFARAYLSPRPSFPILTTIQVRTTAPSITAPHAFLNKKSGYSWIFPLANDEVHIGTGSIDGIQEAIHEIDQLRQQYGTGPVICRCQTPLWHHGPIRPFTEGKVWGLGESIGLVNPASGAGIIAAMTTAQLMVKNWDNARKYETAIWKRYSYMVPEYDIAVKLTNKKLKLSDLLQEMATLRAMTRDAGIMPHLSQIEEYRKIQGLFAADKDEENAQD